jgi:DNA repair protein NreA
MIFKCPFCGGSRLEHLRNCPKVYSIINQKQFNQKAKQEYFGASPNVFVGKFGYPDINVGFLSNEDLPKDTDKPREWSANDYKIPKIVDLRSNLINSRFKANVKSFDEKFIDLTKEIAAADKPVDVEVKLDKKPIFNMTLDRDITPYGPSVKLEKATITENPKISRYVDKVISEDDMKATIGISYLYKKGYDEHFLTKLISVGTLGLKENRKLVPTRWSITAIDDTLGKKLIQEIKEFQNYEYAAYFGGYLGNYYLILCFPEIWSYELFETYVGNPEKVKPDEFETMTDYEPYSGRKDYAQDTVGGYYAARLGILEHLKEKKRQSSVLALRFITDEYYMALGVWVVREATRNALRSKPLIFSDKELMLKYAQMFVKKKFGYELNNLLEKSILLKEIKTQSKLTRFFEDA